MHQRHNKRREKNESLRDKIVNRLVCYGGRQQKNAIKYGHIRDAMAATHLGKPDSSDKPTIVDVLQVAVLFHVDADSPGIEQHHQDGDILERERMCG